MDPEQPGAGGFLSSRIMGIPTIVWIGGIAILAYLYFRHSQNRQAAGSPTTTGGGGTITTGTTNIQKGAVQISVTQQGSDQDNDQQPTPGGHGRGKRILVPKEEGKTYAAARRDLAAHGLRGRASHPYAGKTTGENPAAGTKVRRGSTIMLSGAPPVPPRRRKPPGTGGPPPRRKA